MTEILIYKSYKIFNIAFIFFIALFIFDGFVKIYPTNFTVLQEYASLFKYLIFPLFIINRLLNRPKITQVDSRNINVRRINNMYLYKGLMDLLALGTISFVAYNPVLSQNRPLGIGLYVAASLFLVAYCCFALLTARKIQQISKSIL